MTILVGFISCNAQPDKKDATAMDQNQNERELRNTPKGNWKVTKEVDENGNIIKYDSIYSYSFSTHNGDTVAIKDVDSLIQSSRSFSKDRLPLGWDANFMNSLFFDDTLMQENFFNDDFFQNRSTMPYSEMRERLKYMDSLHSLFFDKHFSNRYKSPKGSEDKR
jgi:hypothetical protein